MVPSMVVLLIVAAVLLLAGVAQVVSGDTLLGAGLIVFGLLVGPGGCAYFRSREGTAL